MQAIQVKHIPATNAKPARLKAWCSRGSITVSRHALEDNNGITHEEQAAMRLCEKFIAEDIVCANEHHSARGYAPVGRECSSFSAPMIEGGTETPNDNIHVFVFLPPSLQNLIKHARLAPCNEFLKVQIGQMDESTKGQVITF